MKSKTSTLVFALRILSKDIKSEDGVANAAILEASERLEEMRKMLVDLHEKAGIVISDSDKIMNPWK